MHNMHEAKWSRAKVDADNRRTKDTSFRAQETNAPHGCGLERHFLSLLWLWGRLEQHFSSFLWLRSRLERHFSSTLRLRGRLEHHFLSILRLRARGLSSTFRAFCGSGASSSGHFEPAAALGQARAAISSCLRPRGKF